MTVSHKKSDQKYRKLIISRIASARRPVSGRSSRAATPTGTTNPFASQNQQSMSFQPPDQSGGSGFGGGFNFTNNSVASNPFKTLSATPPPANPSQFGNSNNQASQQTGGTSMFGNNSTSFGTTFGTGASQQPPQSNGFNPSTTMFSQNSNNSNATPSFTGFGQGQQDKPQQNGFTPSTNNSFPSFGQQNGGSTFKFGQSQEQTQSTPSTSFGGFGQNSQQNGDRATTPSFGGFGATTQSQTNGDKPLFGATSQTEQTPSNTTGSIFSKFNQQSQPNGNKPLFGADSTNDETPKASTTTSSLFGAQQNGTKSLFGASQPPEQSKTPKPGESVLNGLSQERQNSITPTMFSNTAKTDTPKSTFSGFNFSAPTQQNGGQPSGDREQTPKPTSLFSGSNQLQPNGIKPGMFGGTSISQPEQQTPKPSTSLFGGAAQQQSSTPAFKFGQSQQDTSMTTPGNTPQKQGGLDAVASQQSPTAPSETPVGQGRSLFDRISKDPPATAPTSSFKPSTSMFGAAAADGAAANDENEAPATQGKSLFDRITPRDPPATAQKPSFTPSTTSIFSKSPDKPTAASAVPWITHTAATPQQSVTSSSTAPPVTAKKTATMSETISKSEKDTFKVLNEGLRAHLATQDPNVDWSTIFEYYLQQAAKIRNKPEPKFDAPAAAALQQPSAPASSSLNTSATATAAAKPPPPWGNGTTLSQTPSFKPSAPSSTSNVFGAATPKTFAPATNVFASSSHQQQQTPKPSLLKPPSTAPVNRKRIFEEDDDDDEPHPPATEKRRKADDPPIEYPALPANATDTAKLFQAALDKPKQLDEAEVKAREEKEKAEKEAKERAEREKKETESSQQHAASGLKPPTSGFQPMTSGFTPPTSGFQPTTSGFKPSASGFTPSNTSATTPSAAAGMPKFAAPTASAGNFLAAFGKKANEEEEKARKKRKMEDYDSDEETEEAWAARDKEEQEAKRRKIMEDAKRATGFVPSRSVTPAVSEGGKSTGGQEKPAAETPAPAGKSLFDRVTPRDPPATAPSKASLFAPQTPGQEKSTASVFSGLSKTPSAFGGVPSTSNVFGNLPKPASSDAEKSNDAGKDKTQPETEQGSGDHSWKPNTPIKFGANTTGTESTTPAAPPPSGNLFNLFGSTAQTSSIDTTGHLSVPGPKAPVLGFNFTAKAPSLAGNSRATTPGVTTDGEGASTAGEGEGDEDEPKHDEKQVEDQTALREEEHPDEDLIFTVDTSKASKFGEKKNPDTGEVGPGWVDKGKGPLYLLKHRETGKVRVVLRIPPFGNAVMNFNVPAGTKYSQGANGKSVRGTFFDHLNVKKGEKPAPGTFMIQVREPADAKEILRLFNEAGEAGKAGTATEGEGGD